MYYNYFVRSKNDNPLYGSANEESYTEQSVNGSDDLVRIQPAVRDKQRHMVVRQKSGRNGKCQAVALALSFIMAASALTVSVLILTGFLSIKSKLRYIRLNLLACRSM